MADNANAPRVLCVYAHPDDVEFSFGGTVAEWTSHGSEVHYVCVTDGSAGHNAPGWTREAIAEIRQREQRDAAAVLGVTDVVFLGYPDGSLEVTLGLRRDLTREVRRLRPDRVVTLDPTVQFVARRYVNHPDHRAVGEAMMAVVNPDAPSRPQFPELLEEGLEPFEIPELWLPSWDVQEADEIVDIGATIETKIASLQAHVSQLENMGVDDIGPVVRERAQALAKDRDFEYGEAFKVFQLVEGVADGARDPGALADAGSAGLEEG
jgi:LmbE family N-acetylglucosaminyl deacetylase